MFDWVGDSLEVLWRNMMWGIMQFSLNLQSGFITEIILPASKLTFLKSDIVNESYQVFSQIAKQVCLSYWCSFFFSWPQSEMRWKKRLRILYWGHLLVSF
ncbi:hypothetical protein MGH68_18710 [Erysipelothrix sp. D19-032]